MSSRVRADLGLTVAKVNDRLKAAEIKVRVRLNGKVLGLRATLPSKNGIGRKQQDIRLGIPASKDGLKEIERLAHELHRQMVNKTFQWADWVRNPIADRHEMPVFELVQAFKQDYISANKITERTWLDTWQKTFNHLPKNEPLTESAILAVVMTTEPHSDSRKRACNRLERLAAFAGLEVNLKRLKGDYGYRSEKPRDIPPDALIVEWRDRIPNLSWQWVYGMMACFGLRPHECFSCEFVDDLTVKVQPDTKTGQRIAKAIPPEWSRQWRLIEICLPNVTGRSPKDLGQRNKRQFQRYGVPFPAYNLRHAYAIRGSVTMGIPISTMAGFMGHSVTVHTREYHQWLSDATNEAVYRRIVLKED